MPTDQKKSGGAPETGAGGLEQHGLRNLKAAHWNLGVPQLLEHAVQRGEGEFAANGAFMVRTGQFTGRSPKDKFVVRDEETETNVQWGSVNQPLSEAHFDSIHSRVLEFWQGREVYVQDCLSGANTDYAMRFRVITRFAWHTLFARQLFSAGQDEAEPGGPDFTILFAPEFQAEPRRRRNQFGNLHRHQFQAAVVLICGTSYAGEMKKSAFTIMNYVLPARGVLPMHCSADIGAQGRHGAVFRAFGHRQNHPFGGPAAPADRRRRARLERSRESSISKAAAMPSASAFSRSRSRRSGTPSASARCSKMWRWTPRPALLDFDSEEITENTRAAYPLNFIDNALIPSVGGHPRNVVLLTADAFGVLPPISRLTPEQAMYHFLSGYTAKVAGTERGLGKEPQATFSACFGAPFLPASGFRLCVPAGREAAPPRLVLLAGEHRLGGRPVREWASA